MALDRALRFRVDSGKDPAEGYALIERDIAPDHCGFTDHHTRPVIDEKAAADRSAGMNFNAGEPARELHNEPRGEPDTCLP